MYISKEGMGDDIAAISILHIFKEGMADDIAVISKFTRSVKTLLKKQACNSRK